MRIAVQKRIAGAVALTTAGVTLVLFVIGEIQWRREMERVSEMFAVERDLDLLQRELRLIAALFVGGFALWSRRIAKMATFAALTVFAVVELTIWLPHPPRDAAFDRFEPETHILAAVALAIALILVARACSHIVIATIGFVYILCEFLFWCVLTQRAWRASGGDGGHD